ncbi:MAG: 3-hydroxyacyl-CoA dehydrogenase family protein [Myxococcales bacterium]|nr:3-hydroxyacyl-CoA dehydrogenase family protein [Myxococcales bacterium]MCB9577668.1 3-hydroxyacyl-CoA dehydrogenase family protein [Polyangiaceae bacterium]
MVSEIQTVAVIGCGLMGTGIAQACVQSGLRTIAIKATGGDPSSARRRIERSLARAVDKGKLGAADRDRALELLEVTTELSRVAEADLIIESAAENVVAKQDLLRRIEAHAQPLAIIGSNTSSLRLTTLAEALEGTERFVGLHFFSPANVMKLVEIGPIAATSPDVVETMRSFCQHIGKVPVEVGDHPGYLVNRLLVPYILHAIETLEEGVAGPEAIDTAMKLGCAHPMGPLALADHIGLDVVFAMSKNLYAELGDPRYRCPTLLRRLVLAGSLGKKTGAGFYLYEAERTRENPSLFDFDRPSSPVSRGASPAA